MKIVPKRNLCSQNKLFIKKQLNRDHAYSLRPLNITARDPQLKVVLPHI
jgi:hypothetical protein